MFGWAIGVWAFDAIARPLLEFYGKMAAFETLKGETGTWAILVMLVTSGLAHLPLPCRLLSDSLRGHLAL